ncbi:MAG TPA: hypothetical protein DCF65_12300 [Chloroflexi bacterium]|nr:hypothetical protein [Chloroflexota bacterium]
MLDISRLQLVAPKPVSEAAAGMFQRLKAAFDAAQMASSPSDGDQWDSAQAKADAASKSMTDFGDLVTSDRVAALLPRWPIGGEVHEVHRTYAVPLLLSFGRLPFPTNPLTTAQGPL